MSVSSMAEVGLSAAPLVLAVLLLVWRRAPGWQAGGAAWLVAAGLAAWPGPLPVVAVALGVVAIHVGLWSMWRQAWMPGRLLIRT